MVVGVLEDECNELNKRFFTFHQKKRPYIVLKWAESLDGYLAPEKEINQERKPVWITNIYSRQLVHKWRSEEQAILVGTQTVIDDNPKLNVRDWSGNNPVRVVLDQNNRISKDSFVFDNSVKTIVLTKSENNISTENTIYETIVFNKNTIENILSVLHQHQIQSIIIEGGKQTLQSFIDKNIWDEARIFLGKNTFEKGTKAPELKKKNEVKTYIQNDELIYVRNHD